MFNVILLVLDTWIPEEEVVVCGCVVEIYVYVVLLECLNYPDVVVDQEPEREVLRAGGRLEGGLQPDRLGPVVCGPGRRAVAARDGVRAAGGDAPLLPVYQVPLLVLGEPGLRLYLADAEAVFVVVVIVEEGPQLLLGQLLRPAPLLRPRHTHAAHQTPVALGVGETRLREGKVFLRIQYVKYNYDLNIFK